MNNVIKKTLCMIGKLELRWVGPLSLTLSMPRGTDSSFQPAPSMTIVLFIVTALPCQVGL